MTSITVITKANAPIQLVLDLPRNEFIKKLSEKQ